MADRVDDDGPRPPRPPCPPGAAPERGPGRPAVVERNRRALLAAARRLFDEVGAGVPMSRIAQEAGVGQAVLYRVFPTRASAVWAVFDENLAELEHLAATAGLPELLGAVTRQAVRSTGFLQIVAGHLDEPELAALGERFGRALAACRDRTGEPLAVDDLVLAVQMVAGALVSTPPAQRTAVGRRAWDLLGIDVTLAGGAG